VWSCFSVKKITYIEPHRHPYKLQNKKVHPLRCTPKIIFKLKKLPLFGEALAAINRSVFSGLERNLCLLAACCASSREHFSAAVRRVRRSAAAIIGLACITAILASGGFIGEALFSIEILFTCSEDEFLSAISAG